jgi:hypothetical protein
MTRAQQHPAIGPACLTNYYGSSDFKKSVRITKELNKLQVKLLSG